MNIRQQIVDEARTWIGTPFKHQGRVKGVGVDCVGVPFEVAKKLGLNDENVTGYNIIPSNNLFTSHCERLLDKVDRNNIQIGDLLTFSFVTEAQHMAIVSEIKDGEIYIIHSYSRVRKVVEHRMDKNWMDKWVGQYKFKGIN